MNKCLVQSINSASIPYPQEIIFAPGALTRLSEAVERYGWQRLMLCTNRSMQSGGHVNTVEVILGDRLVAAFDQVHPHVQDVQVDEALRLASRTISRRSSEWAAAARSAWQKRLPTSWPSYGRETRPAMHHGDCARPRHCHSHHLCRL